MADEVDVWCFEWAEQKRKQLDPSKIMPEDRLGRLNCTLGSIKEEREGASQGTTKQNFPEVYTGMAFEIFRAYHAMLKQHRDILDIHYVARGAPKNKARILNVSVGTYWNLLRDAKNFIRGRYSASV